MYKSPLLHYRLKFIQSCKQRQTLYGNRATKQTASSFAVLPLFPAQAALCCGQAGEKEKESARGMMERGKRGRKRGSRLFPLPMVPRALSIFSIIAIFIGMPCGSSCGGGSCFAMNLVRGREPGFHILHKRIFPSKILHNHCFQYLLRRM